MKTVDQNFKLELAERLKKIAAHFGLQEQFFAQRLEMSKQSMSNYTTGRNEPKPSLLAAIVNVFNVNPGWLLTGDGPMFGEDEPSEGHAVPPEELNEKLTPAQREMLTYKRLQTELGTPNEKIAAGIDAIVQARGRVTSDKSCYCTAEPEADPGYNQVHEPGAAFERREKG